MANLLDEMVKRTRREPFFFGWLLNRYAVAEGLTDAALAAELGCTLDILARLHLCRNPREDEAGSIEDVRRIAEVFGLSATAVGRVVRRARILAAFQSKPGSLMAARDRDEEPT